MRQLMKTLVRAHSVRRAIVFSVLIVCIPVLAPASNITTAISSAGITQPIAWTCATPDTGFFMGFYNGDLLLGTAGATLNCLENIEDLRVFNMEAVSGGMDGTYTIAMNNILPFVGYGSLAAWVAAGTIKDFVVFVRSAGVWSTTVPTGISVTTNLANATFNITGPASYSGSGTSFSVSNTPPGTYTITYGSVPGYGTPFKESRTLINGLINGRIDFSGSYFSITDAGQVSGLTFIYPVQQQRAWLCVYFSGVDSEGVPVSHLNLGFSTAGTNGGHIDYNANMEQSVGTTNTNGKYVIGAYLSGSDCLADTAAVGYVTFYRTADNNNYGTAGHWSIAPPDIRISDEESDEPSLAIDPLHSEHAVVGFNKATGIASVCGWGETYNNGQTSPWKSGTLQFLAPEQPDAKFVHSSDPWVRYSPTGQLYYSCVAWTDFQRRGAIKTRTIGVFLAVSGSGRAEDLGCTQPGAPCVAKPVGRTVTQQCILGLACDTFASGELTDHPSFDLISVNGGTRVVACWITLIFVHNVGNDKPNSSVSVAFSDDGIKWSVGTLAAAGPKASVCNVGGNGTAVAVTWWNQSTGQLQFSTSQNGSDWAKAVDLAPVGNLVKDPSTGALSTVAGLLSPPYALGIPSATGLQSVFQTRSFKSDVFLGQIPPAGVPTPLGDPTAEKFLPGAGHCSLLVGAYRVLTPASGLFRYSVWRTNGDQTPIFTSGFDLDRALGESDPRFGSLRRIGDYTAVDCSGGFGWAAWTDLRDGKAEIWGARFAIPN